MGQPPKQERAAAVRSFLVADIRGYTRFTSERGDAAASQLVATFSQIVGEAAAAWDGALVELRGDEALLAFDSPRRALWAAVELQDAFADEMAHEPDQPLRVGIGLDAGEAVPFDGGFRGAALNLAARLCAASKAGEVVASQGLVHLAGTVEGLRYRPVEGLAIKGLDEPVEAFIVTSDAFTQHAAPEPVPAREPGELPADLDAIVPLAGRAAELAWLGWHWRRARHGHARTIVLHGVPGIGKTRMAAELARIAHERGAAVSYHPAGAGLPPGLTGPGLVVVDDIDAAPQHARQAALELGAAVGGSAALVLITHRSEAPAALIAAVEAVAPDTQRLLLGPLDLEAVRQIAALYAGPEVDALPLARILDETGGHPASIHRAAHTSARRLVTSRLGASVDLAQERREGLRSAEQALLDDMAALERARERALRYGTTDAAAAGHAAQPVGLTACPYKGLASFEVADADYFFGRERLVAELVARTVGASFLGIVGASGSGKSSAVKAGLLPSLASGVLPGSERWRYALMRPGAAPMAELRRALASLDTTIPDGASPEEALEHVLDALPPDGRLVLFVDQSEELFEDEVSADERGAFIRIICGARRRLLTLAALRADHYGSVAGFPALARALAANQVLVGPMADEEIATAVESPAQRVGLRVDAGLTAALVADARESSAPLPLLSTALLELWQLREGDRLTMAAYQASGRLDGAVARLAEATWSRLDRDEQPVAVAILLRLAGAGDGDEVVRRRASLDEFDVHDPRMAAVIERLVQARLLVSEERSIEVVHEALFREWPRLRGWLAEDAAGRALHRHMAAGARDWDAGGREASDLYRGARLSLALDWGADHPGQLNALERDFLEASRSAAEREAAAARRTDRRLRALLGGTAVLLLLAVVAGLFAFLEARRADEGRLSARQRELTASALAVLDEDPGLAKVLALEAVGLAEPPPETISTLHSAGMADRVAGWVSVDPDEYGPPAIDAHPEGGILALSSPPQFGRPYVEAVEARSWEPVWRFDDIPDGMALSSAHFLPDGGRLVAGIYPPPGAPPAADMPPAEELGVVVLDAATGGELDRIPVGRCGAIVRDATDDHAILVVPSQESCTPPFTLELLSLADGTRRLLAPGVSFSTAGSVEPGLSRDGRFVAFDDAAARRTVVADTETLTPIFDESGEEGRLEVRGLSDDGALLLTGDRPVTVWDVETGAELVRFGDHADRVNHAEFEPGTERVLSTAGDATLRYWDARSGEPIFEVDRAGESRPVVVDAATYGVLASDPGGLTLIAREPQADVWSTDLCLDEPRRGAFPMAAGNFIVRDPAFLTALACGSDEPLTFSTVMGEIGRSETRSVPPNTTGQQQALSPDGRRIARQERTPAGLKGTVTVRDLADGDIVAEMQGPCEWDDTRWDGEGPRADLGPDCTDIPETPFYLDILGLQWSPDGRWLGASDWEAPHIIIWDAVTGELVRLIDPATEDDPGAEFHHYMFGPGGERLYASRVNTDPASGAWLSAGIDEYDAGSWELLRTVEVVGLDPGTPVNLALVGISPDGSTLFAIAGGNDFEANDELVWIDEETGEVLGPSIDRIHSGRQRTSALSPSRTSLATGDATGEVKVWDLERHTLQSVIDTHAAHPNQQVQGLAWLDDEVLGIALQNGVIVFVTTDTDDLVARTRSSLTRGPTPSECTRYGLDPCPSLEDLRSPGG